MAKIMLVEDDNNLREIYGARLMAEGYDIVAAKDGEEALAIAVKEKPDLIISDVMMPKISGFDMLDILRTTPETKDTKVIMMTALSQAEDKARADKLGADRYLVKSQVTLEDVAHVVREVLEGSATNPAAAPVVDAATVAPAAAPEAAQAAAPAVPTPAPQPSTTPATPPVATTTPTEAPAATPPNATNTGLTLPPAEPLAPAPAADASTAPAVAPSATAPAQDSNIQLNNQIASVQAATPAPAPSAVPTTPATAMTPPSPAAPAAMPTVELATPPPAAPAPADQKPTAPPAGGVDPNSIAL